MRRYLLVVIGSALIASGVVLPSSASSAQIEPCTAEQFPQEDQEEFRAIAFEGGTPLIGAPLTPLPKSIPAGKTVNLQIRVPGAPWWNFLDEFQVSVERASGEPLANPVIRTLQQVGWGSEIEVTLPINVGISEGPLVATVTGLLERYREATCRYRGVSKQIAVVNPVIIVKGPVKAGGIDFGPLNSGNAARISADMSECVRGKPLRLSVVVKGITTTSQVTSCKIGKSVVQNRRSRITIRTLPAWPSYDILGRFLIYLDRDGRYRQKVQFRVMWGEDVLRYGSFDFVGFYEGRTTEQGYRKIYRDTNPDLFFNYCIRQGRDIRSRGGGRLYCLKKYKSSSGGFYDQTIRNVKVFD